MFVFQNQSGIKVVLSRDQFFICKDPPFLPGNNFLLKTWNLGFKDFELILFHGNFYLVEYTHQIDMIDSLR